MVEGERSKYIKENKIPENYSSIFILPVFQYFWNFYTKSFISAYLIDETKTKIAICFNNSDDEELKETILELQRNEHFFSIEYDDDGKEVVVILLLPKKFKVDFNLFKIGRYSKFSAAYKELLLDFHGRNTGMGKSIMMVDAIHPGKDSLEYRAKSIGVSVSELPNSEVMSIPDLSREEYRNVKQYIKYEEDLCKRGK